MRETSKLFRDGLLLVTLVSFTHAAQGEMMVNGGFEAGLSSWTFTGNGIGDVASISSDTPTGIGSSADVDINAGAGLPWLIQDVPVQAGTELTFSAWVREVEPASPTDAWIAGQVWMLPNSESGVILSSVALFFTNANWEQQTTQITVPATATVARVLFTPQNTSFGVGTGQYRIDNVSLTVPEPSVAILLIGTVVIIASSGRGVRIPNKRQCISSIFG